MGILHVTYRAVFLALAIRVQSAAALGHVFTKSRLKTTTTGTGYSRQQKCNTKRPLARLKTDAAKTRLKFRSIVEKVNYTARGVH